MARRGLAIKTPAQALSHVDMCNKVVSSQNYRVPAGDMPHGAQRPISRAAVGIE